MNGTNAILAVVLLGIVGVGVWFFFIREKPVSVDIRKVRTAVQGLVRR